MSDALCGPSNALQNFQKHASTDRTLQQDRLTSQQTPSQGFRNHNPSTGVLDPEFAAFESNLAPAPLGDLQHPAHLAAPAPQLFLSGPSESLNWATDFQRLNIADPWAVHHQQPNVSHAPLPSASQQGWHNEFLQHQHQQQPTMQHHHPLAHTEDFESSFRPSDRNMHLMRFHPQRAGLAPQVSSAATTAAAAPSISTFDESAFEAAFAQASAAIASQETATETVAAEETTTTPQQDTDDLTTKAQAPIEQIKIGSDTIPPTEKSTDPQAQANDADALARTAGQLVDSLKHDTSQKFQESNFLALMRRIRDREVEIKGEEFQEVSSTSS
ncbi:hypothetical protein BO86DRAFT_402774 [Aspergillus japonicus CBS 114.51]|uniref:Peroxin 20 n=1 Tax=Aspergillus japonicus CBS 114.51 TaxID=1448312 RepID=A0A8T8WRA2_ASPJA|nr:hypothetical protein BO86DRAFT_402774 [Aspergillus japonicus CBS 114.51]RAH78376.1 hypothetical protein BO86DRAFT_402774 [Aspergillus japonicus CBS 114.51]